MESYLQGFLWLFANIRACVFTRFVETFATHFQARYICAFCSHIRKDFFHFSLIFATSFQVLHVPSTFPRIFLTQVLSLKPCLRKSRRCLRSLGGLFAWSPAGSLAQPSRHSKSLCFSKSRRRAPLTRPWAQMGVCGSLRGVCGSLRGVFQYSQGFLRVFASICDATARICLFIHK